MTDNADDEITGEDLLRMQRDLVSSGAKARWYTAACANGEFYQQFDTADQARAAANAHRAATGHNTGWYPV